MSISQLQRDAFNKSSTFEQQVTGILITESKYMYYNTADLSDMERDILSRTIRMPPGGSFAIAMVADAGWSVSYDTWAADPEAQQGTISAAIHKDYELVTGFKPHEPAP